MGLSALLYHQHRSCRRVGLGLIFLVPFGNLSAQESSSSSNTEKNIVLSEVAVEAKKTRRAPDQTSDYVPPPIDVGPLGTKNLIDTPYSVTVIPNDLIVNQQARSFADLIKYVPTAQIEARGGMDVGRPQTRGFEGSVVQNSRMSGLNFVSTTAYPAELFDRIEILSGLSGALYGPASPSGVFNYVLKRPTDDPLKRFTASYDSMGIATLHADIGGRAGEGGWFGYRINLLHGGGEGYVANSQLNRNLVSGSFDVRIAPSTVVELDASHYSYKFLGYPGGFAYGSGQNTTLPQAPDPTRVGYGQPSAGNTLITDTGSMRIKHDINSDWHITMGALRQTAYRGLYAATNTFTDNLGNYKTTMSTGGAASSFDITSNMAYINGRFETFGMLHDFTLGTNGYIWDTNSALTSSSTTLGTASLANPLIFAQPTVSTGPTYKSSSTLQQSAIIGDTLHFNEQWALMGVLSSTWLSTWNYNSAGMTTGKYETDGELSPTASLIYKPAPNMTIYATYADSLQAGDTAPTTGVVNAGQTLAPYRSKQYEIGYKLALPSMSLTTSVFRIDRPFAYTDPNDLVFKVLGQQVNYGAEVTAAGNITEDWALFGGFVVLDPKLQNTGSATTSYKDVVGVPKFQFNLLTEYSMKQWAPGLVLTGNIHYTSERAANTTNTTYASSYATLDLGARYTTKALGVPMTLRFQVQNVTDTHYWASIFPSNINGNSSATYSAFLGTPRVFQVSLQTDF